MLPRVGPAFGRRLLLARQRGFPSSAGSLLGSASATRAQQLLSQRLITITALDSFKLEELRSAIRSSGGTDERKLHEYLRLLVSVSPKDAIAEIEKGWESGKFPVNEFLVREYLKAAAKLGKMDAVNITGLLALVQQKGVEGAAAAPLRGFSGMGMSMGGSGAGSDPQFPLYVARPEPSWKSQVRLRFLSLRRTPYPLPPPPSYFS